MFEWFSDPDNAKAVAAAAAGIVSIIVFEFAKAKCRRLWKRLIG